MRAAACLRSHRAWAELLLGPGLEPASPRTVGLRSAPERPPLETWARVRHSERVSGEREKHGPCHTVA